MSPKKKPTVVVSNHAKENMNFSSISVKSTKIAFTIVVVPILLLFFGLFADKTLNTTPLFIVVGFLAGLFFGFYTAKKIIKNEIK